VPVDLTDEMLNLMATHVVQPLRVYKDDKYIEPSDVNNVLKGSLVEIHFSLKHYRIFRRDEGTKAFDSFNATIEQILVLKPGELRETSYYKRKNLLDGPYRPKPFSSTAEATTKNKNVAGSSASTTNPSPQVVLHLVPKVTDSTKTVAGSSSTFSDGVHCTALDPVPTADVTSPVVAKEKPKRGGKKNNGSASNGKDPVTKPYNMSDKAFGKTKVPE
jgi:hypothetical protein